MFRIVRANMPEMVQAVDCMCSGSETSDHRFHYVEIQWNSMEVQVINRIARACCPGGAVLVHAPGRRKPTEKIQSQMELFLHVDQFLG
jgi:hypothetical protein